MSHVNKSVFLLFIILVLAYGCGINSNPVEAEYAGANLVGKVVDSEGEPLSGVKIHYMPNFTSAPYMGSFTAAFRLYIHEGTKVSAALLRFGTRDTVEVILNNQILPAGLTTFHFDETDLTSGIYIYVIRYNSRKYESIILILKTQKNLVEANPLITSDINGRFILPHKVFAIGTWLDSLGRIVVTNNISLFFVKDGYNNFTESFQVDSSSALIKTFTMQKK